MVNRGHSWSIVVTRGHSWSLVVTRGHSCHSWSFVCPFRQDRCSLYIKGSLQRSHNLGKFPPIFAVSMGVVLGIMRILCIPFKILLFGNCSANSQPPPPPSPLETTIWKLVVRALVLFAIGKSFSFSTRSI